MKKIAVAMIIIAGGATLVWMLSYHTAAVWLAIAAVVIMANRRFAACDRCGSWLTRMEFSRVADPHNPRCGTCYSYLRCRRCKNVWLVSTQFYTNQF